MKHMSLNEQAVMKKALLKSVTIADDSPFPLKDGTQADPRQAWVLPSNEQEK